MYIKVLKYDVYQKTETYKSDTESDSKSEMGGKKRGDTINKNENSVSLTRMGPVKKYASNEARTNTKTNEGFNPLQNKLEKVKQRFNI